MSRTPPVLLRPPYKQTGRGEVLGAGRLHAQFSCQYGFSLFRC